MVYLITQQSLFVVLVRHSLVMALFSQEPYKFSLAEEGSAGLMVLWEVECMEIVLVGQIWSNL